MNHSMTGFADRARCLTVVVVALMGPTLWGCSEDGPVDPGPSSPVNVDTLDLRPGTWLSAPPIPGAPSEPGIAEYRGDLYAVGGSLGGALNIDSVSRSVYRLEPSAHSWKRLADYPLGAWGVTLGVLRDSLFALGGVGPSLEQVGRLFLVYDPDADAWTPRPRLPESRTNAAIVAVDGKLVVVGGAAVAESSLPPGSPLIFDPDAGSWSVGAGAPEPMIDGGAAAVDGKIYLAGGYHLNDRFKTDSRIRVYDLQQNTWAILPGPGVVDRTHSGFGFIDGRIHLFGGTRSSTQPTDTHVAFVIADSTWVRYPAMPFPARGVRAAAFGDALFVTEAWFAFQTESSGRSSYFRAENP